MKTVLVLSVLLCVAFAAPTEDQVEVPEEVIEAPVKEMAVAAEEAVEAPEEMTVASELKSASAPQARSCFGDWEHHKGNCYYIGHEPKTWSDAERYCSEFQAHLASVHDVWEFNFIHRMVRNGGRTLAWIGGFHFENEWRWQDGSKFDSHRWGIINPPYRYPCLQLDSEINNGFNNYLCSQPFKFICKTRPSC